MDNKKKFSKLIPILLMTLLLVLLSGVLRPTALQYRMLILETSEADEGVKEWIESLSSEKAGFYVRKRVLSKTEREYYLYPHNIYVTSMSGSISEDKKGYYANFTHFREGIYGGKIFVFSFNGKTPTFIDINGERLIDIDIPIIPLLSLSM